MPQFGERVHVRPAPNLRVQRGANLFDQCLDPEGQEVLWDDYHQARLNDGAIFLPPAFYHAERKRLVDEAAEAEKENG